MAGYGVPEHAIARVVGHRSEDAAQALPRGTRTPARSRPTAKVAESLFRKATSDGSQSVTAAILWLKTRGGWREVPQDHRVDLRDARDLRNLTNAELEQIILDANPEFRRRPALPKPGA